MSLQDQKKRAVEDVNSNLQKPCNSRFDCGYLSGLASAYWLADLIPYELYGKVRAYVAEQIRKW